MQESDNMANIYPIWWDTTITIYNKYENPQTQLITWYRTVVEKAFWKLRGDTVTIGEVNIETDYTVCRIRKDSRFLERHEWIKIPNDQMSQYFTLWKGDIIVRGEVEDEINEYQAGMRHTDLLNKYRELQGCVEIDQIGINVGPGRCNEHYFVKGV